MEKIKKLLHYFTKAEITLWAVSVSTIIGSFCIFDRVNFFNTSCISYWRYFTHF